MIDKLTGIFNRKFFEIACHSEIKRATRYDNTLSLVMIKIDGFDTIKDNQGQQSSDLLLKKIAFLLEDVSRAEDIVSRFENETFCLFFKKCCNNGKL